jgi:hypothetical protein
MLPYSTIFSYPFLSLSYPIFPTICFLYPTIRRQQVSLSFCLKQIFTLKFRAHILTQPSPPPPSLVSNLNFFFLIAQKKKTDLEFRFFLAMTSQQSSFIITLGQQTFQ